MRGAKIGRNCKLRRVIIDKWNVVPDGTEIGYDHDKDRQNYFVSEEGIAVLPRHDNTNDE